MIEPISTNSGRITGGKPFLGLEIQELYPTGVGLLLGVGMVAGMQLVMGDVPESVVVTGALCFFVPLFWTLIFVRGKPPNFQRDFFRTHVLRMGSWWRSPRSLSAALISREASPLMRGVIKDYISRKKNS